MVLYDPADEDLSHVLLRCSDLVAFVSQVLYPGADRTAHEPDPNLTGVEPPHSLLWWLSSLQVTLESLYLHAIARPPEPLATAIQAYLAQHPEQAPKLRRILVEANERDFIRWDDVSTLITSPKPPDVEAGKRDCE